MEKKPDFAGRCYLCEQTFARRMITRHIKSCLSQHVPENIGIGKGKPKTRNVFSIFIESDEWKDFWMVIEASDNLTFYDLDRFLRDIWLECCGHLSDFRFPQPKRKAIPLEDLRSNPELYLRMNNPYFQDEEETKQKMLSESLEVGKVFHYEYDYGSTTSLQLKVLAQYELPVIGKALNLLARNLPPDTPCHGENCKEDAVWICQECAYDGEGFVCKKCAKKHKDHKEMLLPVVNSPRAGVCGYDGPSKNYKEPRRAENKTA